MKKEYIYIGGGLLALGGIIYLVNKSTGVFSKIYDSVHDAIPFLDSEKRDQEENQDSQEILYDLMKKGQKPNYSDKEYLEGANKLEVALKGIGNDLQQVAEVFDGVMNEVDVRKLNYHFGIRGGENMNNWLKSDFADNTSNLFVTLKDGTKLSTFKFITVADMVRAILKLKNVQFAI